MELIDFVILFVFLLGAAFVWHKAQKRKDKPGLDPVIQPVLDRFRGGDRDNKKRKH